MAARVTNVTVKRRTVRAFLQPINATVTRLSLHDLLQRDNNNESFVEIIERESAGGYDLSTAYDELGYSDPRVGQTGMSSESQGSDSGVT